jgi:hypothetical protein
VDLSNRPDLTLLKEVKALNQPEVQYTAKGVLNPRFVPFTFCLKV